mgnify:CR=1 FL=1
MLGKMLGEFDGLPVFVHTLGRDNEKAADIPTVVEHGDGVYKNF